MDRKWRGTANEDPDENREEDELNRLKRQLRIMTNDRNALAGTYSIKALQQKKILQFLRKEHVELNVNIGIAKEARKEQKEVASVQMLTAKSDNLAEEIKEKRTRMNDIDVQIRELQNNLRNLKLKSAGTRRFREEKIMHEQSDLVKLENKLDTVIKMYCAILSENSKMREEIESLLKDRKQFNETWEKLMEKLDSGKKNLLDLIEQTTSVFDLREEWVEKFNTLRFKAHNTALHHTDEMRELKRQLDLQNELSEFLKKKCQKRVMSDLIRKEKEKKDGEKAQMEAKLKEYKETLQQIKDFVGENDIHKISSQYLKQEEENFALFTYINELNTELEAMATTTEAYKEKIDEQIEINAEQASNQRNNLASIQEELSKTELETNNANMELNKRQLKLQQMILGITEVFDVMECDNAPLLRLLGENSNINQHNVLLHMTILETRLIEIVKNYCYKYQNKQNLMVPRETAPILPPISSPTLS